MLTEQQFDANDQLDRERIFNVLAGFAGVALGVDPGAVPYDEWRLSSRPEGQPNHLFSITTAPVIAGQPAAVTANVGGQRFTVPVLVLLGLGAWLVLRK